jgi:hypothetical protein
MNESQYPFLRAVKMAFDQTAEKGSDKVFWRLDNYIRGKANLVHVNSNIGDPGQSWKLLAENLVNQYTYGGVRQFDITFKQSPTDPDGKLFPLDLTNEQALKAMSTKSVGIAGFGEGNALEAFGIGGIGSLPILTVFGAEATSCARRTFILFGVPSSPVSNSMMK